MQHLREQVSPEQAGETPNKKEMQNIADYIHNKLSEAK